jgi:hypothetical protein
VERGNFWELGEALKTIDQMESVAAL